MTYGKKPCIRCLLEEAGKQDVSEAVRTAVGKLPPAQRTAEEEYSRRLEICRSCEFLTEGTCLKCGCYVELRAARAASHCPYKKKW